MNTTNLYFILASTCIILLIGLYISWRMKKIQVRYNLDFELVDQNKTVAISIKRYIKDLV